MIARTTDRWTRLTGLSMLALAVVLLLSARELAEQASYLLLLATAMAAGSVLCGIALYARGYFEARLAALVLALIGLLGQGLGWRLGVPGAAQLRGNPGALFWLALALELWVVLLAGVDGWRNRQI